MSKYYAVREGKVTGIFNTWAECEASVKHYSGAKYKSFSNLEDATNYLNDIPTKPTTYDENTIVAYVDGSFNPSTNECGYASYLIHGDKRRIICGRFLMTDNGRNIEGEVKAVFETLKYLGIKNYKNIVIYHDYEGIGNWANRSWEAKKPYTKCYRDFVESLRNNGFTITYEHVYGHTNVLENEYADKLAKLSCGVELTKSEKEQIKSLREITGFPNDIPVLNTIDWNNYKDVLKAI